MDYVLIKAREFIRQWLSDESLELAQNKISPFSWRELCCVIFCYMALWLILWFLFCFGLGIIDLLDF